jgi:pimeloyl-ACP methyl ester carboxylesterase
MDVAANGWTSITIDLRGHGDSDWARDGDYSIDALVADIAAVVSTLESAPVLVGASLGGIASLIGQAERGDLARALVLVDIVPRLEPAAFRRIAKFMSGSPDGFASLEDVAAYVAEFNEIGNRRFDVNRSRKNVRLGEDGRWHWHWDPAVLSIGEEAWRASNESRARAVANRLRVPALLVRGMRSDMVSDEGASEFLSLVPNAQCLDVAHAGHTAAGGANEMFAHYVSQFIASLA